MDPLKIIVLSDIHYDPEGIDNAESRTGEFGDIFLLRAVHRINRYIKPDLVLILGDLVNSGDPALLRKLRECTDLLEAPSIIIPGNHDCDAKEFYKIFHQPPDFLDIKNCRFIPFIDPERPDFNAFREPDQIKRLEKLAVEWDGPVISVQHVPLFPAGSTDCPYNYTNESEIFNIIEKCGVTHTISGHYHEGLYLVDDTITALSPTALCEDPFAFLEVNIDENGLTQINEYFLKVPAHLELTDCHIHSHFAYCNENMDFEKSVRLAEILGLNKIVFAEHSSHLYYCRDDYARFRGSVFDPDNICHNRVPEYFHQALKWKSDDVLVGLEVDCDCKGNPVFIPDNVNNPDLVIGAMHSFPEDVIKNPALAKDAFMEMLTTFLEFPMNILAHPFRIFRRNNLPVPKEVFPDVVKLLKKQKVAAEINFHTNEPPPEFIEMCMDKKIPLAFGSDAHNLYEIGEFYPHLELIHQINDSEEELVLH